MVREENGQLSGPLETREILKKISNGEFVGSEEISSYPNGKWKQIANEPEFYDFLIEAIQVQNENQGPDTTFNPNGSNPILNQEPKLKIVPPLMENQNKLLEKNSPNNESSVRPNAPIIELKRVEGFKGKQKRKNLLLPISVFLGSISVAAVLFFSGNSKKGEVHLVLPRENHSNISEAEIKKKSKMAVEEFASDRLRGYLAAQTKLVEIIESDQNQMEARALLCFVYKEIWSFTSQDDQEAKVFSTFAQNTRAMNLTGAYGNLCEAARLFSFSRVTEARGVVETLMDNVDNFSLLPLVYVLKAEILILDRDFLNAEPFLQKGIQLWPTWQKPHFLYSILQFENKKYPNAIESLNGLLSLDPQNKKAKIYMGKVLFKGLNKIEDAQTYFQSAAESKEKIERRIESEGLSLLAEIYHLQHQDSQALSYLNKALKIFPGNGPAKKLLESLGGKVDSGGQTAELISLGEQYFRQGDFLSAQAQFKAAFEADNKNAVAALKAAKCLWELYQSTEALRWLDFAIKADPKMVAAFVAKAEYLTYRYDFLGASQTLLQAQGKFPNNSEVQRGLALLEFQRNNMVGAINFGERAAKLFEGDIETFILLSKANLQLSLALVPQNSKDAEKKTAAVRESIKYATKAIELDGSHIGANVNYGKILAATNGVDAGVRWLTELIKKFAQILDYRLALADLLGSAERHTQAITIYQQVVDADPKKKKAFLGLGQSLLISGQPEKALKAFLSAAVLDPSDAEAGFLLGKLYLQQRKFDEAIKQLKRVEQTNSNYPGTYNLLGRALLMSGRFDEALQAAQLEKTKNPNVADPYLLTAEIFQAKKHFSDCASEYAQAIKLRPFGAEIYVRAAQCYRQAGSLEIAEDMLALASSQESGFAEIYREQGAIFEIRGDQRAAIKAYETYIELSPNALDKKEIEVRISKLGG